LNSLAAHERGATPGQSRAGSWFGRAVGSIGAEGVSEGPTLTGVNHFKWLTLLWMRGAWMTRHGWKCRVRVYMLVRSTLTSTRRHWKGIREQRVDNLHCEILALGDPIITFLNMYAYMSLTLNRQCMVGRRCITCLNI
jgi:hypothetical protein